MLTNTKKQIDGWLIIDKPYKMGSTQVVSKLKWALSPTKIGHAGTLDPLATGVLPIALGKATKLIPFVMDGEKIYDFQITWGSETETDDVAGAVTETSPNRPTEGEVRAILPSFIGVIEQLPPAYSALKINGKRAYDLARAGQEVVLKPRAVAIKALYLLRFGTETADFRVICGKGTYVRSLGRDIGRKLGCLGHISALRRVACGPFKIDEAVSLDDFQEKRETPKLISVETALGLLPKLICTDEETVRLKQGQRLSLKTVQERIEPNNPNEGVLCLIHQEKLIGLAIIRNGVIQPHKMFI